MSFTFTPLEIPEVLLIAPRVFSDDRGFFLETLKRSESSTTEFLPSYSQPLALRVRGAPRVHYQKDPMAQGKLVMAVCGEIFDVGVDIRRGSPTYGMGRGAPLCGEPPAAVHSPRASRMASACSARKPMCSTKSPQSTLTNTIGASAGMTPPSTSPGRWPSRNSPPRI